MTLGELHQRASAASRREKLSLSGFLRSHRISDRTFQHLVRGNMPNTDTAARLLALAETLRGPGEEASLELGPLTLRGAPAVRALSDGDLAAAIAASTAPPVSLTHSPN